MLRKIFLIAALIFSIALPTNVEAREVFGVVDIVSRIDETMTNFDGEELQTFHAVSDVLIEELIDVVDVIDLTAESNVARLGEIATQLSQGNCSEFADADCDYIIYGYLMNLNRSTGDRIVGKSEAVTADVSIRVVEKKTGKCVFVAKSRGVSKARAVRAVNLIRIGSFEFSEEQLIDALESAARDIAKQLKNNI